MDASRLGRLHSAVDRQVGERVRIRPQAGGGYVKGGDDPARAATIVAAYAAFVPNSVRTSGNAANSGANVQLRQPADTVKFSTSDLPYKVAEGDIVEFLDAPRAGLKRRVARVSLFSTDRTVLSLVPVVAP